MIDLENRLGRLGRHLDDERAVRAADVGAGAGPSAVVVASLTAVSAPAVAAGRAAGRTTRILLTTAAAVLLLVGAAATAGWGPAGSTAAVDAGVPSSWGPPVGPDPAAPAPGTLAPFVASPPAWFGEPAGAERPPVDRPGQWVSAAIGVVAADGTVTDPILVSATDGAPADLDDGELIDVDGTTVRSRRYGGSGTDRYEIVASVGPGPTILVGGSVERSLLLEVLAATRVVDHRGLPAVQLDVMPAGYRTVADPHEELPSPTPGRVLAGAAGDAGISDVSGRATPELAAAATGATHRPVTIGDTKGWIGTTDVHHWGPVTFLIWSPGPGILLELDVRAGTRTAEELVGLAESVILLPVDEWDDAVSFEPTGG